MTQAIIEKQQNAITAAKTLENLAKAFSEYIDVKSQSARTYKIGIKAFFKFLFENGITQPDRQSVINFRDALLQSGKSVSTVQTYLTAVKSFASWLCDAGFSAVNIANKVKAPCQSAGAKKDSLTEKQLKEVLRGMKAGSLIQLRDKALVTLIASCGLRTIEASRANIDDIRTRNGKDVIFIQGKGHSGKDSFLPMPKAAKIAIDAYLQARGRTFKNAPLFCSFSTNGTEGKALSTRSISGICKAALQGAGIDSRRITAHSLRHTAATACLRAGISAHAVQLYLRHQNINTTMIYAHEIEQAENPCASCLDAVLL
jgi:integrase/recombinase XerC